MINLLASCNPCGCIYEITLDQSAILITLVICVTILAAIVFCLLFLRFNAKKRIELEKEKRQLEDCLSEKANELEKVQIELNKLDSYKINEEKKKKEFLDYCYKMAKSLDKGNEKQKEDCWKIILHNHAECIPDELKKEYKVGKTE